MLKLKLAAFADEISPDLDEQISVCRQNGVTHFELRGVAGKNVLDFDKSLRTRIKTQLAAAGLAVAAIGSPIGKVRIDEPWPAHFERFKIAVDSADYFSAHMIRLFSFYPPNKGDDIHRYRDEVLRRLTAMADHVQWTGFSLVLENEKDIYGEKGRDCLDLLESVHSPNFRAAFDFANFVQAGENPLDNWPSLKPFTAHIHIKDARRSDGQVVPAGQGDGQIAPILKDAWKSGYRGFLSLEPHLAAQGQFSGFSGPDLFTAAATALKKLCRENDIPLANSV